MTIAPPPFAPISQADLAWLGTAPIPAAPYYDPAWYADEVEAIFRDSWIEIGHVCELPEPGRFIRRELECLRASILITRPADGAIRAFHNVCTHRGTQLVEAEAGSATRFRCPYHSWTFGMDGRLLSAPDFAQFHIDKADCALPAIACEVVAGLIFVNLAPAPRQDLRSFLGDLAEHLEALPVARATCFTDYVYEIDANWKLTYDNFQENYHLRFIHPRSGGAGMAEPNPYGYPVAMDFHGPHRRQTIWSNPDPQISAFQMLGLGRGAAALATKGVSAGSGARQYYALFPNFFLLGSPGQHFSHVVYPLGPERSRGVIRLYWVGEDATPSERFAREYAAMTARDVHAEDRAVITAGQRGLSSRALSHIHFQTQEALCRHFFGAVEARVLAWRAEAGR